MTDDADKRNDDTVVDGKETRSDESFEKVLDDETNVCLNISAILLSTLESGDYDESSKAFQPNRQSDEGQQQQQIASAPLLQYRHSSSMTHQLRSVAEVTAEVDLLVVHTAQVLAVFDEQHGDGYFSAGPPAECMRRRSRSFGSGGRSWSPSSAPRKSLSRTFGSDTCLLAADSSAHESEGRPCPLYLLESKDKLLNEIVGVEIAFGSLSDDDTPGGGRMLNGSGSVLADDQYNGYYCETGAPFSVMPPVHAVAGDERVELGIGGGPASTSAADGDPQCAEADPDWLHSSGGVWLDKWNECGDGSEGSDLYAVKERVWSRRRSRRCQGPDRGSLCKTEPVNIESIDTATKLDIFCTDLEQHKLLNTATYEVTIPCGPLGVGVNFCTRMDNLLAVHDFAVFPLGSSNYAKLSGLISVGDILVAVNGKYVAVKLRFRYGDALYGHVKRPPVVLTAGDDYEGEDDTWRDVGESWQSRQNSISGEDDGSGDNCSDMEEYKDRNSNPLFDIIPTKITTNTLQKYKKGKRCEFE
ncbi:unnamed protein product, partial [Symbiodinium microadriaticum]